MDREKKTMRNLGLLLAASTPISGIITFAFVSVAIGEDRLENESGTTALGFAAILIPLVVGLAFAAYAHFGGPLPSRHRSAVALVVFGLVCMVAGIVSVFTSETASIGGGLLFIFGIFPIVVAAALLLSSKPQPPPPETPPSPL